LSRLDNAFKDILAGETGGTYGKATESAVTEFQKKYFPDEKPTGETGPSTRKKLNELCLVPQENLQFLKFTITTINQPQLIAVANSIKDYWQKIGATIDIKTVDLSELKTIIKNRDYDALLYGQALGLEPDLYPFWHSSQIIDPGLNLSGYQNKDADQLLKNARETLDEQEKIKKYEQLQNIIVKDAPAVFLYNPNYLYWASKKVQGIETTKIVDPAKRFSNIQNWYINTKRVLK
jgi:peptide/nickel transport system substrate-binding protein